jgi:K+-transporting ATPase ATPase C chain
VLVSGGSNYGPLHPALRDEVAARIATLRATGVSGAIPVDLVTRPGCEHLSARALKRG